MNIDWAKLQQSQWEHKNTLHLVISGDREYTQYGSTSMLSNGLMQEYPNDILAEYFIDKLIAKRLEQGKQIYICMGDNKGIDTIALEYAKKRGYSYKQFVADWERNGNRAGYKRNEDMFLHICHRDITGCILFWNGENVFTKNLIYQAYNYSVPARVFLYEDHRWLSQEEVAEIQTDEYHRQQEWLFK